jgi:hypothetical protein
LPEITDSSFTMSEMVTHAYFLADEEPNAVFKSSDVERLVNMGIRRVVSKVGYPTVAASTLIQPSLSEYPLVDVVLDPSENAKVSKVRLYSEDGSLFLAELSSGAFDPTAVATGTPNTFTVIGESVFLTPIPDATLLLEVSYRSTLPRYSGIMVPPLSSDQTEVAIYFAVWQMKLRDDQASIADRWKGEYDERMTTLGLPTGVYKAS